MIWLTVEIGWDSHDLIGQKKRVIIVIKYISKVRKQSGYGRLRWLFD